MGILLDLALAGSVDETTGRPAGARVIGGLADIPDDLPWLAPLTESERSRLLALADAWGMDDAERAAMLRQCERGGQAVDGTKITPEEARAFWFAEATRVAH